MTYAFMPHPVLLYAIEHSSARLIQMTNPNTPSICTFGRVFFQPATAYAKLGPSSISLQDPSPSQTPALV